MLFLLVLIKLSILNTLISQHVMYHIRFGRANSRSHQDVMYSGFTGRITNEFTLFLLTINVFRRIIVSITRTVFVLYNAIIRIFKVAQLINYICRVKR